MQTTYTNFSQIISLLKQEHTESVEGSPFFNIRWQVENDKLTSLSFSGEIHRTDAKTCEQFEFNLTGEQAIYQGLTELFALQEKLPASWAITLLTQPVFWKFLSSVGGWVRQVSRLSVGMHLFTVWPWQAPEDFSYWCKEFIADISALKSQNQTTAEIIQQSLDGNDNDIDYQAFFKLFQADPLMEWLPEDNHLALQELHRWLSKISQSVNTPPHRVTTYTPRLTSGQLIDYNSSLLIEQPQLQQIITGLLEDLQSLQQRYAKKADPNTQQKAKLLQNLHARWKTLTKRYIATLKPNESGNAALVVAHLIWQTESTFSTLGPVLWEQPSGIRKILQKIVDSIGERFPSLIPKRYYSANIIKAKCKQLLRHETKKSKPATQTLKQTQTTESVELPTIKEFECIEDYHKVWQSYMHTLLNQFQQLVQKIQQNEPADVLQPALEQLTNLLKKGFKLHPDKQPNLPTNHPQLNTDWNHFNNVRKTIKALLQTANTQSLPNEPELLGEDWQKACDAVGYNSEIFSDNYKTTLELQEIAVMLNQIRQENEAFETWFNGTIDQINSIHEEIEQNNRETKALIQSVYKELAMLEQQIGLNPTEIQSESQHVKSANTNTTAQNQGTAELVTAASGLWEKQSPPDNNQPQKNISPQTEKKQKSKLRQLISFKRTTACC